MKGPLEGPIQGCLAVRAIAPKRSPGRVRVIETIMVVVTVRGPNRPRRGREPAPGRVRPMPSPGGNTTRPDRRRPQGRSSSAAGRRPAGTAQEATGGLRGLQLDPGRAGWSRRHGSGVPPSAQRPRRARALPHRSTGQATSIDDSRCKEILGYSPRPLTSRNSRLCRSLPIIASGSSSTDWQRLAPAGDQC